MTIADEIDILALAGCGARFPAELAAAARAESRGVKPKRFIGTSGGALASALLAAFGARRAIEISQSINPAHLLDGGGLLRLGRSAIANRTDGLYSMAGFKRAILREIPHTLDEMPDLAIVTCELATSRAVIWTGDKQLHDSRIVEAASTRLTWEAHTRDVGAPRWYYAPRARVADVVCASMAIPIVFDPQHLRERVINENGVTVDVDGLHADGGLAVNYPVNMINRDGARTLGVAFRPRAAARNIANIADVASASVEAAINATMRQHLDDATYARTIWIDDDGVPLTSFNVDRKRHDALVSRGEDAADAFFMRARKSLAPLSRSK